MILYFIWSEILHLRKWILSKNKKPLRPKQITLSPTQFHTCKNHKKVTPLKLKDDLDSLSF